MGLEEDELRVGLHGHIEGSEGADELGEDKAGVMETRAVDAAVELTEAREGRRAIQEVDKVGLQVREG